MKPVKWALMLLLLGGTAVAPAHAEVSYTITVTDEQGAIVAEQARRLNVERRRAKNPPPDLTPADLAKNILLGAIDHMGTSQARDDFEKDRAAKRGTGKAK